MTDIHDQPVESAATAAPADDTAPADESKQTDTPVKKGDMRLLAKLKSLIKKVLPRKKEKHAATTTEDSAADAPADSTTAPESAPLQA